MKCEYCNKETKRKVYGEYLCEYHYEMVYLEKPKKNDNFDVNKDWLPYETDNNNIITEWI
jgi:hypothetical protein